MNIKKTKRILRIRRHSRLRGKIKGTMQMPRLVVFRSAKYIYAQLIDDIAGKTLVGASSQEIKSNKKGTKADLAKETGLLIAKKGIEKKISKVVFDRGGYQFHGRVKALADGAREGGLKF